MTGKIVLEDQSKHGCYYCARGIKGEKGCVHAFNQDYPRYNDIDKCIREDHSPSLSTIQKIVCYLKKK